LPFKGSNFDFRGEREMKKKINLKSIKTKQYENRATAYVQQNFLSKRKPLVDEKTVGMWKKRKT
jgi:hypothetical protein